MLVMSSRISTGDKWHNIETETDESWIINKLHNLWEFYFRHILLSSELRRWGIEHFRHLSVATISFCFSFFFCVLNVISRHVLVVYGLCDDFHLSEIHANATKLTASSHNKSERKCFYNFTLTQIQQLACHNKILISSNIFSVFIMFKYRMFGNPYSQCKHTRTALIPFNRYGSSLFDVAVATPHSFPCSTHTRVTGWIDLVLIFLFWLINIARPQTLVWPIPFGNWKKWINERHERWGKKKHLTNSTHTTKNEIFYCSGG